MTYRRNLLQFIVVSVCAYILFVTPVKAEDLMGSTLSWQYYAYGGAYHWTGGQTNGSFIVDGGVGGTFNAIVPFFNILADAKSITFDYSVRTGSGQFSESNLSLSPTIHNGIAIDMVSGPAFTSVKIDPSTNMSGFDTNRISFTNSQIQVDWQTLPYDNNTIVKLDVNSTEVPYTPKIYGLFVGSREYISGKTTLKADVNAENLSITFQNLPGHSDEILLQGDSSNPDQITKSDIKTAIDTLFSKMKPNDTFIMYMGNHGGINPNTGNATISVNNAAWTPDYNLLSDDDLTGYIKEAEQGLGYSVNKWIFLDACHSGGFWGDTDLNTLNKIKFFASSYEDSDSYYSPDGLEFFGNAINEAWQYGLGPNLNADFNKDGILTFAELGSWVLHDSDVKKYENTFVHTADFGDPVLFTSDMWNPFFAKSDDFNDNLYTRTPEPTTMLLLGLGLMGLAGVRRKFKN